jgi:hypothetical protein
LHLFRDFDWLFKYILLHNILKNIIMICSITRELVN